MATIDPNLVPAVNPGSLFTEFTTNSTYNVRWLTATDPAYWEILNRPMADITLRQLILSKAVDDLNVSLGYQAMFPFITQPQVSDGSTVANVPVRTFWDHHVSIPVNWINLRLARIDRLDASGSDYVGTLRFIFTAQQYSGGTSSTETALFYADYEIDSDLTYQRVRITPATVAADVTGFTPVGSSGSETIDGEIIFRTLDTTDSESATFLDLVAPGTGAQYEIVDSVAGGTGDFDESAMSHGTGLLTSSAFNLITPVDADPLVWLESMNYPFDLDATRTSNDSNSVVIPDAMFREFDIVAPAGDAPDNDSSGLYYPVWISKIVNEGDSGPVELKIYFSTYAIDTTGASDVAVEFGILTLNEDMLEGQVVNIIPNNDLYSAQTASNFTQDFGRGHVVLSSKWGITGGEVATFFSNFPIIAGATNTVTFAQAGTRIGSMGISRVPEFTPTQGQSQALVGTSSERDTPLHPSSTNRYVTEQDEGLGDSVDLNAQSGIAAQDAIERYGYMATRSHKLVKLVVDPEQASEDDDPDFYADEILPRLRILLERDPIFGDQWYNGHRFMTFNGDSWIG